MTGIVLALLLAPAALAAPPTEAPAADDPPDTIWLDAAITAGAGAGWFGLNLAAPSLVETRCPCTRDEVNGFDRFAVDQHLSWGEPLADGLLAAGLLGSLAAVTLDGSADDRVGDALIVLQSAAIAGLLNAGLKVAVARPYPYMYGPAPYPGQNGDGVNYASFPSGHTAAPMAAAVSAAYLFARRHPRSDWRWVMWTVGPALALAAGAAQVSAANHFPSDVIGGALIGAGVGWLDPWLHGR